MLVGKSERGALGRSRLKCEDKINMDLKRDEV
jgi:hypothetical protein